jgi:hypothetical protein
MSEPVYRRGPYRHRARRWIGTFVAIVGGAEPVRGPTRKQSLVGIGVTSSELANPNLIPVLVGISTDSEELEGAPRAAPIGAGSNSMEEV